MLNRFSNRFVKLEVEREARGYSYLNSYKGLNMVPLIFTYIIIPISFRKPNYGPEAIIQGRRNEVIIDKK